MLILVRFRLQSKRLGISNLAAVACLCRSGCVWIGNLQVVLKSPGRLLVVLEMSKVGRAERVARDVAVMAVPYGGAGSHRQ